MKHIRTKTGFILDFSRAPTIDHNTFHEKVLDILDVEGTENIHESIIEAAKSLLKAEYGNIGIYDHKKKILTPILRPDEIDHKNCRIHCQRIMDTVNLTRLPLKMDSDHPDSKYFFSSGDTFQSYLAVPLISRGHTIGVLTLCNINTGNPFTDSDLQTCLLLASYSAVVIRNDQIFKDTLHRAQTDFLTGLFNYRYFIEVANVEINRAQRYNHPLTALMFDVDHFKMINDTFGHSAGDLVLCSIADLCRQFFRNVDIVCRYGGEEFFVLLPETSIETAKDVAERLRSSVESRITSYHKQQIHVTISIGISSLSSSCTTINRLIERADTALYSAKKQGRNQVALWNPAMRSVIFISKNPKQYYPTNDLPSL